MLMKQFDIELKSLAMKSITTFMDVSPAIDKAEKQFQAVLSVDSLMTLDPQPWSLDLMQVTAPPVVIPHEDGQSYNLIANRPTYIGMKIYGASTIQCLVISGLPDVWVHLAWALSRTINASLARAATYAWYGNHRHLLRDTLAAGMGQSINMKQFAQLVGCTADNFSASNKHSKNDEKKDEINKDTVDEQLGAE